MILILWTTFLAFSSASPVLLNAPDLRSVSLRTETQLYQCDCHIPATPERMRCLKSSEDWYCQSFLNSCTCAEYTAEFVHLHRRGGCLSRSKVVDEPGSSDPPLSSSSSPRDFINDFEQAYQNTLHSGSSSPVKEILTVVESLISSTEAPENIEPIQKDVSTLSDDDLLLVSKAIALNFAISPGLESYDSGLFNFQTKVGNEVVLRLRERGYDGFAANGDISPSEAVLESFREMHPEARDMNIQLVNQDQFKETFSMELKSGSGDTGFILDVIHKTVVYIHRGADGEKAIFLLDSAQTSPIVYMPVEDMEGASDYEIYNFELRRQNSDNNCLMCCLHDLAAVKRVGPENLLTFARALGVGVSESSWTKLKEVNTLPGEFYLVAESMSSLENMATLSDAVDKASGDLREKYGAAFENSEVQKVLDSKKNSIGKQVLSAMKRLHETAWGITAGDSQYKLFDSVLRTKDNLRPLDVVTENSLFKGRNQLLTVARLRIYENLLKKDAS